MIHEESEFVKMMSTNLLGPQVDMKQLEQRINTKSNVSQVKIKPDKKEGGGKIERVTAYKKGNDLLKTINNSLMDFWIY